MEQREQEYAQARLRILGSAHPEEEPTAYSIQQTIAAQSNANTNNNGNRNVVTKHNIN